MPFLRHARRRALVLTLPFALAAGWTPVAIAPAHAEYPPPSAVEPRVTGPYLSAPPTIPGTQPPTATDPADEEPQPAPTAGVVVGRVVSHTGRPLSNVLVQGIRFSDLGPGINFFNESPVLARTGSDGRFRLRQLTERYLIRVCDAPIGADQCAQEPADKRFAPTYLGPDGVTTSWLPQTRFFRPRTPTRAVGTITARRSAVLVGVFANGADRSVRLLRRNGTVADQARTDEAGRYRFEVAPGRYRLEVDHHEGLRTVATVPGYRSPVLTLSARRRTEVNFSSQPAATVHGLVSLDGVPLAEQLLVVTDVKRRFAAGVVTDAEGRYSIASLKPGRYRISSTSWFAPYVPASVVVELTRETATRADVELTRGGTVSFSTMDPGGPGEVNVELRDAAGRVYKQYRGDPTREPGGVVELHGLAPGPYQLVVRRAGDPFSDEEQTEFPWTSAAFRIEGDETVALGTLTVDQPTLNLTGVLPVGAQVKFTTVPSDRFLRPSFIEGANATGMTANWTEQAEADGRYLSRGVVPGRYSVTVTTQYRNPPNAPSAYEGNIAATRHVTTIAGLAPTADFSAPQGGIVRGRMRYAGTTRPLIAPVGYEVLDGGDQSWLFPTVSGPQRYRQGFRVDRLHAGVGTARLLDLQALLDRAYQDSTAIPQTLLASARLGEAGTPYWLAAEAREVPVEPGTVTDVGWIDVRVRR